MPLAVAGFFGFFDETPEGVRIQLVDQDGRSMFEPGKAEPKPYAQRLLQEVARVVSDLPNRISIAGHTDGAAFQGPGGNCVRAISTGCTNKREH